MKKLRKVENGKKKAVDKSAISPPASSLSASSLSAEGQATVHKTDESASRSRRSQSSHSEPSRSEPTPAESSLPESSLSESSPSESSLPAQGHPGQGHGGSSRGLPALSAGWTFLTNHSHVLLCLYRNPEITLREVSILVGITERMVQKIVAELVEAGYLNVTRIGRRNTYEIALEKALRHSLESHRSIGDLLQRIDDN